MQLYSLGGLLVGILAGTILAVWGTKKKQKDLAFIGFCCCVFFGSIGGLILITPIIAIFLWLIWKAHKKLMQSSENESNKTVADKFYDEVARELQEKTMVAGLWTKAYAETNGDDAKARAQYIKYRVEQLAETSREQFENDRLAKKRQEEEKNAAVETEKRKTRTRLHRFCHGILLFVFILLTVFFCFGGLVAIIVPFTEATNSSDLIATIAGGIFSFLLAWACVVGAKHCNKETK